jgi:hypothetical protein
MRRRLRVTPAPKGGYRQALDRYKDFTYKEFHKYIARKMEAFYERQS